MLPSQKNHKNPTFVLLLLFKILLFSYFSENFGPTFLLLFHLGPLESLVDVPTINHFAISIGRFKDCV